MAGKHKAQGSCGELLLVCPDAWWHEQSLERTVQRDGLLLVSVAEIHFESSRCSDDKLPAFSVGMCSTVLACRDIVDIEHAAYRERHMFFFVYICQTASRIFFFWQLY